MSNKSKQTKVIKSNESEFSLKDFKVQVETLVQRLMTFTLRNTALDSEVPSDRDTAESLYEQILQGFAILSEVDCYVGTKTNELARYMSRLTENHHKLNAQVEVEPEPPVEVNLAGTEVNLAGTEVNNEEMSDEDSPVEEKKSKAKAPTKKKQPSDDEEEEKPHVEEKKSKSKSKSKSKKQDSDEDEEVEVEVEEKPKKSKSKSKKQNSDEEEEVEEEEKPKKPKGKKN